MFDIEAGVGVPYRIAIVGGFDVSNFGDLLFPLLARAQLARRLGDDVALQAYGYRPMSTEVWPYPVRPVCCLAGEVTAYDALLIGGGLLVRTDEQIASGYGPTDAWTHLPLGLWLIPSLTAKLAGVPVAWNAPGVRGEFPTALWPLLALTLETLKDYVAVRDTSSARSLFAPAPRAQVQVVPDTAFDAAVLLPERPTNAYLDFCQRAGLDGRPYIVLQPSVHVETAYTHVEPVLDAGRARGAAVLELPIGPVNGDHAGRTGIVVDVRAAEWPDPLLLTEVIGRAEAAVGDSLHLSVVATACGVPVYRPRRQEGRHSEALIGLRRVYEWEPAAPPPAASQSCTTSGGGRQAPRSTSGGPSSRCTGTGSRRSPATAPGQTPRPVCAPSCRQRSAPCSAR